MIGKGKNHICIDTIEVIRWVWISELGKLGCFLLHDRKHGNRHVVGLEERRVEGLDVFEAFFHAIS